MTVVVDAGTEAPVRDLRVLTAALPAGRQYLAILRALPLEFDAVAALDPAVRARLRPLFDVPPPDPDPQTGVWRQPIQAFLTRRAAQLAAAWQDARAPLADGSILDDPRFAPPTGPHYFGHFLDAVRAAGCPVVPVTGPGRTAPYRALVADAIQRDGLGLALRLGTDALVDPPTLAASVAEALAGYDVTPAAVDLIVDWRSLRRNTRVAIYADRWAAALQTLQTLPTSAAWRSLTFAASTMPFSLGQVRELNLAPGTRAARALVPRLEWRTWLALRAGVGAGAGSAAGPRRMPAFGDYGIRHPRYLPADGRVIKPVANLRYAVDDAWVVYRGSRIDGGGAAQLGRFARHLVRQPEFAGAPFSAGDRFLADVAGRRADPTARGALARAGSTHHLTEAVYRLALLPPGP